MNKNMKSQLSRNVLALAIGAALTVVLVSPMASAQTSVWRVDRNPPLKVWNALWSISALNPSDVWAVGLKAPGLSSGQVLVKHWNGAAWKVVSAPYSPSWDSSTFTGVSALAANDVWAVGNFTYLGGTPPHIINSSVIEHFDGVSWSIVPSPQSDPSTGSEFLLNAVTALSANDVWAVGYGSADLGSPLLPLYEHWDGTAWTAQFVYPYPNEPRLIDLFSVSATSPTDVWAAGRDAVSTYDTTFISHWDGQRWTSLPTPNVNLGKEHNDLWSIHAITPTDAWAVGYGPVRNPGGFLPYQDQTLILHWDGSSWKIVPSPNINNGNQGLGSNRLFGVTAVSATDVWAGGTWSDSSGFSTRSLVEHWDGVSWTISSTPTVAPETCGGDDCTYNFLSSITALATGQVWTAGQYSAPRANLGLILDKP